MVLLPYIEAIDRQRYQQHQHLQANLRQLVVQLHASYQVRRETSGSIEEAGKEAGCAAVECLWQEGRLAITAAPDRAHPPDLLPHTAVADRGIALSSRLTHGSVPASPAAMRVRGG